MKNSLNPFESTPAAILAGSLLITLAILLTGGIIKIGKPVATTITPTTTQASAAPAQQAPKVSLAQVKDAFSKSAVKFGDTNKKLVVVEVADPSCPFCQIAAGKNPSLNKQVGSRFTLSSDGGSYVAPVPEIRKLVESGKASYAYIYFPGHGNGEMGMKALYCANEKGKFWDVHDKLMSSDGYDLLNNNIKNDKSKSGDLANFLAAFYDPSTLKACIDSGKYDKKLQDDAALATSLGVSGTPGFFLNDTEFSGAYSFTDMQSTVQTALGS